MKSLKRPVKAEVKVRPPDVLARELREGHYFHDGAKVRFVRKRPKINFTNLLMRWLFKTEILV